MRFWERRGELWIPQWSMLGGNAGAEAGQSVDHLAYTIGTGPSGRFPSGTGPASPPRLCPGSHSALQNVLQGLHPTEGKRKGYNSMEIVYTSWAKTKLRGKELSAQVVSSKCKYGQHERQQPLPR